MSFIVRLIVTDAIAFHRNALQRQMRHPETNAPTLNK